VGHAVQISALALLIGTLLGALICLLRTRKNLMAWGFAPVYIAVLRGTPVLMLLLLFNYGVFARAGLACMMGSRVVRASRSSITMRHVRERCERLHITGNMLFNAAFACLLGELNGRSKALCANVISNRDYATLDSISSLGERSLWETDDTVIDNVYYDLRKESLMDLLDLLTPRSEKILRARYGINDGVEHTLEEVGQMFGLTRERIRQIEAASMRKLIHSGRKIIKRYSDTESSHITGTKPTEEKKRGRPKKTHKLNMKRVFIEAVKQKYSDSNFVNPQRRCFIILMNGRLNNAFLETLQTVCSRLTQRQLMLMMEIA